MRRRKPAAPVLVEVPARLRMVHVEDWTEPHEQATHEQIRDLCMTITSGRPSWETGSQYRRRMLAALRYEAAWSGFRREHPRMSTWALTPKERHVLMLLDCTGSAPYWRNRTGGA